MVLYPRDHKPADHLQYTLMSFSPGFPKIVVNVYNRDMLLCKKLRLDKRDDYRFKINLLFLFIYLFLMLSTVFVLLQMHSTYWVAEHHHLGDFLFCCCPTKNKKTCWLVALFCVLWSWAPDVIRRLRSTHALLREARGRWIIPYRWQGFYSPWGLIRNTLSWKDGSLPETHDSLGLRASYKAEIGSSDVKAPDVYAASHVSVETLVSVKRAAGYDYKNQKISHTVEMEIANTACLVYLWSRCTAQRDNRSRCRKNPRV